MKKGFLITVGILLVIILLFYFLLYQKLKISNGYAAKNLCSCLFVGNIPQEYAENNDLNFSIVGMANNKVDFEKKEVTSDFYGMQEQKAVYREGYGCSLLGKIENIATLSKKEKTLPLSDTLYWPFGLKEQTKVSNTEIEEVLQSEINSNHNTRAILVIHNGKIIGEKYKSPFHKDTRLVGWSMTKSIMSTWIGILEKKKLIDINDALPFDEWKDDDRKIISWDDALHMETGLEWEEEYDRICDATEMLYVDGDVTEQALEANIETEPNKKWYYSSGTSNLLSKAIRKVLNNDDEYHNYLSQELYSKIGMQSAIMEVDAVGNFVGSSYSYMTARDWAKLGLLYLWEGNWNGQQIIDSTWVEYVQEPVLASKGEYGAHFWLNRHADRLKDIPEDTYIVKGFQKQRIFIIPSEDLVVVRLGLSRNEEETPDFNKLISDIIKAL